MPENLVDPIHLSFILSSQARSLVSRPWDFLQASYFYPIQDNLAFSEQHVGAALLGLPAWLTTHNPLFLYNFVLILSFFLSAFTAYLLLKEVTGSRAAAFVGGVVYAFVPYRLARLNHIHVLMAFWIPLLLLYLWRFAHSKAWKDALKFAAVLLLQIMTGIHVGAMTLIALPVALLVILLAVPTAGLSRSFWGKGVVLTLLVIAAVGIMLWPYVRLFSQHPEHRRPIEEIELYSGGFQALVTAPGNNRVWGPILDELRREDPYAYEKTLFLGVVPLLLGVFGIGHALRRPQRRPSERFDPWPPTFGMLALVGWALAIGPRIQWLGIGGADGIPSLHGLLLQLLPGLSSIRVPGRFIILTTLGLAGLSAYGVLFLTRFGKQRGRLLQAAPAVLVSLLLLVEFDNRGVETVKVPPIPQAYQWIASQPPAPILSLPTAFIDGSDVASWSFIAEAHYLYYASAHWRPMINGYSSNIPILYRENIAQASTFPSQESVAYLKALGIRYVVVHTDRLESTPWHNLEEEIQKLPNSGEAARFGSEIVLDLRRMAPQP